MNRPNKTVKSLHAMQPWSWVSNVDLERPFSPAPLPHTATTAGEARTDGWPMQMLLCATIVYDTHSAQGERRTVHSSTQSTLVQISFINVYDVLTITRMILTYIRPTIYSRIRNRTNIFSLVVFIVLHIFSFAVLVAVTAIFIFIIITGVQHLVFRGNVPTRARCISRHVLDEFHDSLVTQHQAQ